MAIEIQMNTKPHSYYHDLQSLFYILLDLVFTPHKLLLTSSPPFFPEMLDSANSKASFFLLRAVLYEHLNKHLAEKGKVLKDTIEDLFQLLFAPKDIRESFIQEFSPGERRAEEVYEVFIGTLSKAVGRLREIEAAERGGC